MTVEEAKKRPGYVRMPRIPNYPDNDQKPHWTCKLTWGEVRGIRMLAYNLTMEQIIRLAERHDVTVRNIYYIWSNSTWSPDPAQRMQRTSTNGHEVISS